jgi:hypothetical protein
MGMQKYFDIRYFSSPNFGGDPSGYQYNSRIFIDCLNSVCTVLNLHVCLNIFLLIINTLLSGPGVLRPEEAHHQRW